jgi:alkylation response protein AidB-like acyl-CoA dehydrogenase
MALRCPIEEQRFVLEHVARIHELTNDSDIVDALLDGAAQYAEGKVEPLNRIGDTVGAKWSPDGVAMPPGFHDAYRLFVEGGWGTISAPEEAGGQGLPLTLGAAVMEDLNAANLAFALCPMLTMGAIEAIGAHGNEQQKRDYLPRIVSGEWPATMNLTEPQAGSDVGALRTKAVPNGDGSWAITGSKIYITYGEHDLAENIIHLVLARTPDAPVGTRGISLFLVPKVLPDGSRNDLRCASIEHKLGIHASPTCTMVFGDNGGATGWLIGPEHGGMRAMFTMMNNARLNVGLQGVGIAEAATQRAVAYALGRVQSARAGGVHKDAVAIHEHPDVRRMLLRMKALTMGARALTYYAFGQIDRGHRGDAQAAIRGDVLTPMVKAWGTDVGCEVANLGIQVHGGMGFVEETGAAQHLRDARIAPIYEGTNGIQAADLVGRKLGMDGGLAFDGLIADIRAEIEEPALSALADAVEVVATTLRAAGHDDRLAGSYPFLTMCSVLIAGWLLERQSRAAAGDTPFSRTKRAAAGYFLAVVVPEALGLAAGAEAGAKLLYSVEAEALA